MGWEAGNPIAELVKLKTFLQRTRQRSADDTTRRKCTQRALRVEGRWRACASIYSVGQIGLYRVASTELESSVNGIFAVNERPELLLAT